MSINCKDVIKEQNIQVSAEATKLHTENESLKERIDALKVRKFPRTFVIKLQTTQKEVEEQENELDAFVGHLGAFEQSLTALNVRREIYKKFPKIFIRIFLVLLNLLNKKDLVPILNKQ